MCVRDIDYTSVSMIFSLVFGIFLTVHHFFFHHFIPTFHRSVANIIHEVGKINCRLLTVTNMYEFLSVSCRDQIDQDFESECM